MAEKEEGFEVVDKRRAAEEPATDAAESTAPPEPAGEAEDAEAAPSGEEQAGPGGLPADLDVYMLLSSMVGVLHSFAWQKMGFVANRATGDVETDLPQAKVAIDTVQFIAGKLESELSEPEVRELRRLVMDLQMNYMRKSGS